MDGEIEQHVQRKVSGSPLFSRKYFYLFLFICYFIPHFFLMGYVSQLLSRKTLLFTLLLVSLGICGLLILLRGWEKKMRRSVSHLVRMKIEQMSLTESSSQETQATALKEQAEQIQHLLEQERRGYEHQVDLLQSSVAKSKDRVEELTAEMEKRAEETRQAFFQLNDLQKEYERLKEELSNIQEDFQNRLSHKESLLNEYQHTISEQRTVIEKKQRYITRLEGKVRDLMYEIRSLLQLEEPSPAFSPNPPLVEITDQTGYEEQAFYPLSSSKAEATSYDLSVQLQRYIQMAQSFTGIDHLGYVNGKSPRFIDMSFDTYAIDQRRLFDCFRDENVGIIFVYSHLEEKFLFANNLVRSILGWSAEKFMKDFSQLVSMGFTEWNQALTKLPSIKETKIQLVIQSKTGEEILFHCFLGMVSQGPFINHAIGILAPADHG